MSRFRELEDLSQRLTDDGRGALASLQRELEEEMSVKLDDERVRLREELACERVYTPGSWMAYVRGLKSMDAPMIMFSVRDSHGTSTR